MKNIRKGKEPRAWVKHRCTPHANFDNDTNAKQKVRESLVKEQGGICCYCMQRIYPTGTEMKVEHWLCYDLHPTDRLSYANFLGACQGGEGQPLEQQHCDTRKGNSSLSRNPSVPAHNVEGVISYLNDGSIQSSDPIFNEEINTVLNLNLPVLVNQRKGALEGFKAALNTRATWPRPVLTRKLSEWRGGSGELKPFCQVIVYYLEKRLARGDP
jgi:uncharacterized protein (TIGR02646 family)